ncbi:hypothetical protein ACFFX1_10620 [Dactylosporangium sucinum]|uniref:Uncharacterized protein n=1 Tax=Dactylosporangium sucinum TaxID=1424081 RepID=A0A917TH75_9ACTN|nr:hypothetical protein [Dactylosporangium sucinum]GGM23297.1 hypothetical protein GCM10007977_025620 [Dactylosporangium sucinum]
MAEASRSTAEVVAAHGFRVDPERVRAATARLRAAQAAFAGESARRGDDAQAWTEANDRESRNVA